MKYSYTKAKRCLSESQKHELEYYMKIWRKISSAQNVIYGNTRKEFYLRKELFEDLFNLLLLKKETNPKKLQNFIFDYFKKYQLEGDFPDISSIRKLGFVLTEHSIKESIRKHYFEFFAHDETELDIFINGLRNYNIDPDFKSLTIKKFDDVLWITFDETSPNPFQFLKFNSRKEIYVALALTKWYLSHPIILFQMPVSEEIGNKMRKATVFDANNYKYFRPPKFNEKKYGFTNPHQSGKIKVSGETFTYNKRPEIVCDVREIKFRHIDSSKGL